MNRLTHFSRRSVALAVAVGLGALAGQALAGPLNYTPKPSADLYHPERLGPVPKAPDSKPFAEHFFVFQISDGDEAKQTLVLNNLRNAMAIYGDKAVFEVVAYGPGLRLLFKENENYARIKELAGSGATFSACANTMRGMGRPVEQLNASSKVVEGGIVRLNELSEAGWTLIRP